MPARKKTPNLFVTILWCGLLVGTLDILAAFANAYLSFDIGPTSVLKYIASGIIGQSAHNGGTDMVVIGLLMHYAIAYVFTLLYFFLYPLLGGDEHNNILIGAMYGVFIWLVMNLAVVPLTKIPHQHIHMPQTIINMLILIIMIGIPLSFVVDGFYSGKTAKR